MQKSSNVQQPSAVVLVVDGFGAGFLEPYGNTWIRTPWLCRLASESFLCEQAIVDTPQLTRLYRSYWQGLHAMCPGGALGKAAPLAELLDRAAVTTALLTDEPAVVDHPLSDSFQLATNVPAPEEGRGADDVEQTQMARLFAEAAAYVADAREPFLLWIHARGMMGPWDAPLEFRSRFADEDDPTPPELVEVPRLVLPPDNDPDELLGIVHAYAGQVVLLDACIGGLLDALATSPLAQETLLTFTSSRGFPLGEHGRIGPTDRELCGEVLHVPWMLRLPSGEGQMQRTQTLVQPPDLFATLADWFDLSLSSVPSGAGSLLPLVRGESDRTRQCAAAVAEFERAIRTPAWFLRVTDSTSSAASATGHQDDVATPSEACTLYVKPDDRWEVNEISGLCGDIAQELLEALDRFAGAAQVPDFSQLPPLQAVLTEGL